MSGAAHDRRSRSSAGARRHGSFASSPTATRGGDRHRGQVSGRAPLDDFSCVAAAAQQSAIARVPAHRGSTVMPRTKLGVCPLTPSRLSTARAGAAALQIAACRDADPAHGVVARVAEAEAVFGGSTARRCMRETMVVVSKHRRGQPPPSSAARSPLMGRSTQRRKGTPPSVFWVDRYEASAIDQRDGALRPRQFERATREPAELAGATARVVGRAVSARRCLAASALRRSGPFMRGG